MTSTIEDALHAWVVAASGLAASSVLWSDYEQPRPSGAYIALRLSNVRQIGQDWYHVTNAPAPAAGAEIVTTVWGKRAATLTLQAFGGAPTGTTSPAALLDAVRTKATLPTIRNAINVAGVGIAQFGPVQVVSAGLGSSAFEPRAVMPVELNLTATASEFATFIETVEITDEITDDEFTVEA